MREFKDGGEPAGGTDPLTRVDFWKRERVTEPPADHKTAGRARRRLAGSVSLDRIVAASPGPAAPQAAPRDAEQANHQRQFERGSALDWRQPDVAVLDGVGVGSIRLWTANRFVGLRGAALNGVGFARANVSRRAGAVAAVVIAALGVAVLLVGQLGADTAGRARAPRVSAASIGNSPADRQPLAATRQNTQRSSAHVARRRVSRRVVRQRGSSHVTRHPAVYRAPQTTAVATHTQSTPPPTSSPAPARPVTPAPAPTPSPVSNPSPGHSSGSGSGSSGSKQPTWGQNGSLGPGHGVGTG